MSDIQQLPTTYNLKEAALRYAELGLFIFPCAPGRKWPRTPNGFHDSTLDAAQIEAWWTETPDANIGLDCGRSQIAVMDIDTKPRRNGSPRNGWDAFKGLLNKIPDKYLSSVIPCSRTPSGGVHLFFNLPLGFELRSGADVYGPGLDVRAHGGYVLLPPSRLPNGDYEWTSEPPTMT